jgi:hypothetical protein
MASELRVDTLKDSSGSNSVGMAYVANGSAKNWVNYDGSGTISIRDSLNAASLTDNGTGDHTVNFTNSMANTTYSVVACATNSPNTYPRVIGCGTVDDTGYAASSYGLKTIIPNTGAADDSNQTVTSVNGDLA